MNADQTAALASDLRIHLLTKKHFNHPDTPLHANAMLKMAHDGIIPKKHDSVGPPLMQIKGVKANAPLQHT